MPQKKKTEKQVLLHKVEVYEKVFENIDEEIMLLGRDMKILWANGKTAAKYGTKKNPVTGNFCYRLTHNLDHVCQPPYDICPVEEVRRQGKPISTLHTHFDQKGEKRYVEVAAYPVVENGEMAEFIHISRDVTERILSEERLKAQQQSILELSTPVVKLWDEIIALPLVGIIDSTRARQVMENLLQAIVATQASIAILDITGVPMVDTEVADRLLRTIRAAGLLGTRCLMVGIKPEIAQSMVHLGVELQGIETFSSLQAGLAAAFALVGVQVVKK